LERTDTTKRQNDKTTKRQNDKTTKRQNDKTTKLYTHHHNSDTFREALNLPCSLCFRIWIYIHRRLYGRFERLAQSNWSEFDRLTPITYELPKRLKLQKKYTEYCLVFFISDFEQVCLILEPWNGKVFVALRLSVSPRAKRLLEAQLQLYTHSSTTSTDDDSALQFLVNQNQNCQLSHIVCQRSGPVHEFCPTRLIDVTSDDQGLIRLCENLTGPYTALPHC
jgi:hypothetical protein